MSYIDSRNEQQREIHSIYSKDISDYIVDLSDLKELNRISAVSKNRGVEKSLFNVFPYKYSRLDHSFGVAIILENFKQSKLQVTMGMFHECAKPSFSYSLGYLLDYFKIKDYDVPSLYNVLISSDNLIEGSFNSDIPLSELSNYKKYSLGFADFPKLSANNLEYILSNSYFTRVCELREIAEMYNNLSITLNEDNEEEFCFSDLAVATKFCKVSIEMGKKRRSYESKITIQLIADVLMLMIRREEISIDDLFKYSDDEIMNIGKNSSDKRIQEGWEEIESLCKVFTKFNPTNDRLKYCVKVDDKSIYIDPLVKTKLGTYRLSSLSESIDKEIKTYLETDTDMYMYIDYEL